jgi:hypothetical protein
MNIHRSKKIVLLGMMSRFPAPGNMWLVAQYLVGFQRLGFEAYYVEAHGLTPSKLMDTADDDASAKAAALIDGVMRRFDLADRWAFHAVHADGRCYGLSSGQLARLYDQAELIINIHGGTVPRPEHTAHNCLVYLETDPVEREIQLYDRNPQALAWLQAHCAFFTWGLNYGQPDCRVPLPAQFTFRPTLPPVIDEWWNAWADGPGTAFTTVGNWRQPGEVRYRGECYTWSKHHEFLKFLDLPRRTAQPLELALGSLTAEDAELLTRHGWRVRPASDVAGDLDRYRRYLAASRGEFTAAKDQNVRLRSGWFSERSAQYLAAGRPVATQDTGFGSVLPSGAGLFAFTTLDEAQAALEAINSDYDRHRRAASTLAREYFHSDVVLRRMLDELGISPPGDGGPR